MAPPDSTKKEVELASLPSRRKVEPLHQDPRSGAAPERANLITPHNLFLETLSVANSSNPSRSENDDTPAPLRPSERTPASASLASTLALARELAERLTRQQNDQGETWRLACALSLNIVDLLESTRANDAPADKAGNDDKTTAAALDPFTR